VALERLVQLIELAPDNEPLVRLAALLRPPPAEPTAVAQVAERWRMANRDAERLLALTKEPLPDLEAPPTERVRDLHQLGAGHYADLVTIAAAEASSDPRGALADALAAAAAWRPKRLPVGGDDLLALGVPAGPRVGAILAALEAWWVAQDFAPDRTACLAEARRLVEESDTADGTAAHGKPGDSTGV
jgi:poly(A) polymerase